ncbi:MAG TPA: hypothetical protein VFF06_13505 [Polyangia bacterium]|nr:hypothetical protein [Polyangia bacterium]
MKYRGPAALGLLLCACTVANPSYVGDGADGGGITFPDGSVLGHDGGSGGHVDLASGGQPDLTSLCTGGTRSCVSSPVQASEVCAGGQVVVDRACPTASVCDTGYCAPPPQGSNGEGDPCDQNQGMPLESNCTAITTDLSCQPFVDPMDKSVSWTCAQHVGPGLPGQACTSGKQCRTGFCGSNGTCFRGCFLTVDCPNNGKPLTCTQVTIEVEGVMVTAGSCIP